MAIRCPAAGAAPILHYKALRDTISSHIMASSASVRDLRNRFPRVRKLLEAEGEVVLTERGKARYRLTLYTPPTKAKEPPPKDYLARMKRYQPKPMSRAAAKAFYKDWRGER